MKKQGKSDQEVHKYFLRASEEKIERKVLKHYLKKWELPAMMSSTWQNKSFSTVFSHRTSV